MRGRVFFASSSFACVVLSFLCYRRGVGLTSNEHSLSLRPFKFHDYPWGLIDNIRKSLSGIYTILYSEVNMKNGERYGGRHRISRISCYRRKFMRRTQGYPPYLVDPLIQQTAASTVLSQHQISPHSTHLPRYWSKSTTPFENKRSNKLN